MEKQNILNNYSLSSATLRNWVKLGYIDNISKVDEKKINTILSKKNNIRRNKRNNENRFIPQGYISDKNIVNIISKILSLQEVYKINDNEILIETIIKILGNRKIPNEVFKILGKRSKNKNFKNEFQKVKMEYNKENDFLGCLYMSLLSIGNKDKKGIFYTPFKVVKKIVDTVDISKNKKILDPGCGSGNFLIQIYKKMKAENFSTEQIISSLYGYDIDNIAVLITKINLYSLDEQIDYNHINVIKKDFLSEEIIEKFDIIVGNPPWGKKYSSIEKKMLVTKFGNLFAKQDSFTQFIIRSFKILNPKGILSFVLPSSILNISAHQYIRDFLLSYQINYIHNIGREFSEIVTDVIIIQVTNTPNINNYCIYNQSKIKQIDFYDNPYHNFLIPSKMTKQIIQKIKKFPHFYLDDSNSNFFLGIVTGNNKELILDTKIKKSEPIICGKNIKKYNLNYLEIQKYIIFNKNKFQQVAPEKYYRMPKIVYKFIGKKLCFAVDEKGLLTLNSANNFNVYNLDIYYVAAILNSRVTQLYFSEVFNTHKVLKNHIQSFPIFNFDEQVINKISKLAKQSSNYINEEIESIIYYHLKLNNNEKNYLINNY